MKGNNCVQYYCDIGYVISGKVCKPICKYSNERYNEKTNVCDKNRCYYPYKLWKGKCMKRIWG